MRQFEVQGLGICGEDDGGRGVDLELRLFFAYRAYRVLLPLRQDK